MKIIICKDYNMENSVRKKDVELMCWFLELEFPKTRVKHKKSLKTKRFKRGVVIPNNYTSKPTQVYTYNNREDMEILFPILRKILHKVFMFEVEDINTAIIKHFNLS